MLRSELSGALNMVCVCYWLRTHRPTCAHETHSFIVCEVQCSRHVRAWHTLEHLPLLTQPDNGGSVASQCTQVIAARIFVGFHTTCVW